MPESYLVKHERQVRAISDVYSFSSLLQVLRSTHTGHQFSCHLTSRRLAIFPQRAVDSLDTNYHYPTANAFSSIIASFIDHGSEPISKRCRQWA